MSVLVNPTDLAAYLATQLDGDMSGLADKIDEYVAANKVATKTQTIESEHQCMARTWNGGEGGQCGRRRSSSSDFCKTHGRSPDKPCKGCSKNGAEVTHAEQWIHLGRVDEDKPSFFPGTHTPKLKAPAEVEDVGKIEVKIESPKSEADDGVTDHEPFTPPGGTSLTEIEMDGQDYMWNDENGDLYDKEIFESTGKLKKVGEYNDDDEDSE